MKKYILFLLSATILYSCEKGGTTTVTTSSQGTVRFTNASLYTYGVYLNGSFQTNLTAGHSKDCLVNFGPVTWEALQQTDSSVKLHVTGTDTLTTSHNNLVFTIH